MTEPRKLRLLVSSAVVVAGGILGAIGVGWACTPTADVNMFPTVGAPGDDVAVTTEKFTVGAPVEIRWGGATGPVLATGTGPSFTLRVTVPETAKNGIYYVTGTNGTFQAVASFTVTGSPAAADPDSGDTGANSPPPAASPQVSDPVVSPVEAAIVAPAPSGETVTAPSGDITESPAPSGRSSPAPSGSSKSKSSPAQAAAAGTAGPGAAAAPLPPPPPPPPPPAAAAATETGGEPSPLPLTLPDDLWGGFGAGSGAASLDSDGPAPASSQRVAGVTLFSLGVATLFAGFAAFVVNARRSRPSRSRRTRGR